MTNDNGCRVLRPTASSRLALLLAAGLLLPCALFAQNLSAAEILRKADQSVYPDDFRMQATMTTLDSGSVQNKMEMRVDYKRLVGTRIELLSPPRSRGMRFLQKDNDLWMFNPRAGSARAIRLSPRASFQGSVFSNRDVGDPQYEKDYNVAVAGTETIDQPGQGRVKAIVLEGRAKNQKVAYSRIKIWVRSSDYMMLKAEYYAKSGLLFKRAIFERVRMLAGRMRPTLMLMTSMDTPNKESRLSIDSLQADVGLPDSLFTIASLTR